MNPLKPKTPNDLDPKTLLWVARLLDAWMADELAFEREMVPDGKDYSLRNDHDAKCAFGAYRAAMALGDFAASMRARAGALKKKATQTLSAPL